MDELGDLIPVSIFGAVVLVIVFGAIYWAEAVSCEQRAVSFKESKYGAFSGCMVSHNDKWLPLDNIRGFDDKTN